MTQDSSRKWAILAVVTLVSFVTNLDATIVIIGLPRLIDDLRLSIATGMWTITSYLITSTIFLLPAGKWADVVGTKRIFLWGFALFTIATVLCGMADTGTTLILFRFIQGVGAAFSLATATPILMSTFSKEQLGFAIGINSTSWVIGSIVGPVVGGAFITSFGWRSLFFLAVPFASIGFVVGWFLLKESVRQVRQKTDWIGILTFGLGLTSFLVALSEGPTWGWHSGAVLTLFGSTLLLLGGFVMTELKVKHPLFHLHLFTHKSYTTGLGITLSYCIGYFSISTLLTFYLQKAQQLSPLDSGLLLIPLSAPQLVMGPLGGRLADRLGSRRMMIVGLLLIGCSFLLLGNLGVQLSNLAVTIPLFIISVANGLSWPSVAKTVLTSVPPDQSGSASGMFYTIYNIGRVLSQTLALIIMEFSIAPQAIGQDVLKRAIVHLTDIGFRIFAVFFLLALVLVLFMQKLARRQRVNERSGHIQR